MRKWMILYDIHLHNCDEHVQVNADEVDEFMTEHGERTIKFKLEGRDGRGVLRSRWLYRGDVDGLRRSWSCSRSGGEEPTQAESRQPDC